MKKILHILGAGFFLALVVPGAVFAAAVSFDMPKTAAKGQEMLVTVKIDTAGDKINAVSGSIVVDPSVELRQIYDGTSAVTLWLERPHLVGNSIVFSGITPGGFQGSFKLFTFSVLLKNDGSVNFGTKDLAAYKNNGEGTAVSISFKPAPQTMVSGTATSTIVFSDTVLPETFIPLVSSSPDLFNGKPFISWSATDKGSGINHYEYAYTWFAQPGATDWKQATSPLELDSSAYSKEIYIKAVDASGNERIVWVAGPNRYRTFGLWGIIILIALSILCAFPILKRRSSSTSR
jgi:hypothetical protein